MTHHEMPRLLACDIDGTLLDPSGRRWPDVRDAVLPLGRDGAGPALVVSPVPVVG